jgi:hypothetical protein
MIEGTTDSFSSACLASDFVAMGGQLHRLAPAGRTSIGT